MVAERKAKESKTSASERTLEIPGTESKAYCSECDEVYNTQLLAKREDHLYECPSCAMPMKEGNRPKASSEKVEKNKETSPPKSNGTPAPKSFSAIARSGAFCGDCGAEWPLLDGKLHINCGHTKALRVDDPRKASAMKQVTASGVVNPPEGPPTQYAMPPNVSFSMDGNRMIANWGKVIFPAGELLGISKFNNMEVGPFSLSATYEPSTQVQVFDRMLADLQKMADKSFDVQLVWFKQKLGLIK